MPAASNSALWWVESGAANGTEDTAIADTGNFADGEVIAFNETSITATGGHVFNSEFRIRNSVAENPKVDGNGNDVQDMGLDGVDVQITGLIGDADGPTNNLSMLKFMNWINEAKTTTGYTEGRFGLRIDDFPYFNMVPTSTYGYVLNDITFVRDPTRKNKAGFIMNLRVGGDLRGWFDANGYNGE
jgi:hypothetical protein